jgi:heme-degrading monooxygenase HmoA
VFDNIERNSVMPVVQVASAPSRAEYEAVTHLVALEDDRPSGLLVHAASERSDGTVEIVDVWESQEQMNAFAETRLHPAFHQAGITAHLDGPPPVAYAPFHFVG